MPTYDTPNSQHTYEVPTDAVAVDIEVVGGSGGSGGRSRDYGLTDGGAGGKITGRYDVTGGETLVVYVGQDGADGNSSNDGGPGGSTPYNQLSGGNGTRNYTYGGGGGAPSVLTTLSGAIIALGEGGGGGAGGKDYNSYGAGAGGGGARGGRGGAGNHGGSDAEDGDGTGAGGDGADAESTTDGGDGGTEAGTQLSNVSTGSSKSGPHVIITAQTPPAAPTDVTVTDVRATEVDLSWTDVADDEDKYKISKSRDGGATWTDVTDLPADTTSTTVTGLRTGEEYVMKVTASNEVGEKSATATPVTTDLPDEDQPQLGNGVEDEVAVDRETAPSNYGDVRIQIRETDQSSWDSSAAGFAEFIGNYDTLTMEFVGREDGEEYEVRARTETEHRTGAWTTSVSTVTAFPSPSGPTTAAVDETSVTLSWTDNADNEDGFRIYRRKQYESGFGPVQQIASLGPNTESYTDDTVQPGKTYQFEVEAYTPYSTASDSLQVTTTDAGVHQRAVPSQGWYVEIDHPDGTTRTLQPGEDAQAKPTLNDLPEVVIPVRQDSHWAESDAWERQPMRVWRDGDRLPITQLAEIRETPAGVELVGRGGIRKGSASDDIRQVVERQPSAGGDGAHTVIRDILSTVGIPHTVDDPPAAENQLITTLDATSGFDDYLITAAPAAPIINEGDQLRPARTCYIETPQEINEDNIVGNISTNWTSTEAVAIDVTDSPGYTKAQWTVDLDYDLDASDYGIYIRAGDDFYGTITLYADGQEVGYYFRSSQRERSGETDVAWVDIGDDPDKPDLSGSTTFEIQTTDGGDAAGGTVYIDCIALFDTDYWTGSNFDNTLNADNKLDGPPGLYAPVDIDFHVPPLLRATGARLEATLSSTANGQALGVAPGEDPDESAFTTTAGTETLETDFGSSYGTFIARATLGGVDATSDDTEVETSVTRHRTEPQTLSELTLTYDSLNTPTVARPLEDRAIVIINELGDRADIIWELQWDPSIDDIRLVACLPGQRTSDADPELADYNVTKNIAGEIHRAVIRGRTERVTGETFVADPGGTSLDNDRIKKDSERVYDPSTGEEFERGSAGDYTMEYLLGNINAGAADSAMTDGETYAIDYEEKARGEAFQAGTDFQNPVVEDITALTTDAECEEAATFLVQQLDEPLWTADVTIPRQEAGFDLIDEIDPSRLPSPPGDGYRLNSVDESPREIRLTLGSRPTLSDTLERIRASVRRTARDV